MRDLFRSPHSTRIIFDTLHCFPLDGEKGYQQNKRKKRVVYLKPTEDSTKILKLYSSAVLEAVQKERLDDVFDFQPSDALHLTLCKTRNMLIHRSDLNDLTIEKPLVTDCRFVRLYKIGSTNGSGGYLSYGGVHFIEEDFDNDEQICNGFDGVYKEEKLNSCHISERDDSNSTSLSLLSPKMLLD